MLKPYAVNTATNVLIMQNNMPQMHLKLFQKQNKTKNSKTTEATDVIGNKAANKITKFQDLLFRIVSGQLKIKQKISPDKKTKNHCWSNINVLV